MRTRKDVRVEFELDIKGLCANLATDLMKTQHIPLGRIGIFKDDVRQTFKWREGALAKLETVKVNRVHLQALANALQDGMGYLCFGNWERCKKCTPYQGDKVCIACKAISPLLKDDC